MGVQQQQEIEAKFQVRDPADLERIRGWLIGRGGRCSRMAIRSVRDVYLDSAARDFYRAGWACRVRRFSGTGRRELTVKSLRRPVDGVATRAEWTEPVPAGRRLRYPGPFPGVALARRLPAALTAAEVRPIFMLVQRRRVFDVVFPRPALRVEISLDETRLSGAAGRLWVVEFELKRGSVEALRALVEAGRRAFPVRRAIPSKFAWALRAVGLR